MSQISFSFLSGGHPYPTFPELILTYENLLEPFKYSAERKSYQLFNEVYF